MQQPRHSSFGCPTTQLRFPFRNLPLAAVPVEPWAARLMYRELILSDGKYIRTFQDTKTFYYEKAILPMAPKTNVNHEIPR